MLKNKAFRRRSTSFYISSDEETDDATKSNDRPLPLSSEQHRVEVRTENELQRVLKANEIQALDDGLEYYACRKKAHLNVAKKGHQLRGKWRRQRGRSTSVDNSSSDQSESEVERPTSTVKQKKIKIMLLGDLSVGKTSLVKKWALNWFCDDLISTAGVDYTKKVCRVLNEDVIVQLWDTAGQERFHVITHSYYSGCDGILLVYDASSARSERLEYWLRNIHQHADPQVAVGVVCNKIDLLPVGRAQESGQALAGGTVAEEKEFPFFLTSAKTGEGVEATFSSMIEQIVMKDNQREEEVAIKDTGRSRKKISFKKCSNLRCTVS